MATLHDLFHESCRINGNKIATLSDNGIQSEHKTYKQLQEIALKVSEVLKNAGVQQEVVGMFLRPTADYPAVLLGILDVQGTFYTLDLNQGVDREQLVINKLGIRFCIVHKDNKNVFFHNMSAFNPEFKDICDTDYLCVHLPSVVCHKLPVQLAYVITTSGTTGQPKIVKVPHECILSNVTHIGSLLKMTSADLVFQASPLTFDPSIVELFMTLVAGACLLIIPEVIKMMPVRVVDMLCNRHSVTVLQCTPSLLYSIGGTLIKQSLLSTKSNLRVLAMGGEAFPLLSTLQAWRGSGNSTCFYNLYGITEVSSWASCYCISEEDFLVKDKVVPLGASLHKTTLTVKDADGQVVSAGEGHLYIGGETRVCLLDDELQPECMRPTGDVVAINKNGELFYKGRTDSQVKRHGKRLNLLEIQQIACRADHVEQAITVLDQSPSQCLCVFILAPACKSAEEQTALYQNVSSVLAANLPQHYQPDYIYRLQALPITPHGKVDKRKLQQIMNNRDTPIDKQHLEEFVMTSWKKLCGIQQSGIPTSFLKDGGNSFTAVKLSNMIEHAIGKLIPLLLDTILNKTFNEVLEYIKFASTENCNFHSQFSAGKRENVLQDSMNSEIKSGKRKTLSESDENCVENKDFKNEPRLPRLRDEDMTTPATCKVESAVVQWPPTCSSVSESSIGRVTYQRTSKCLGWSHICKATLPVLPVSDGELQEFRLDWTFDTGKCVDASPLVSYDRGKCTVYIGSHSHKFSAVCLDTGKLVWEVTLPDRVESSACMSRCGQFVIVGCYDGGVYVIKADTGAIDWVYLTGGHVKSSPCVNPLTGVVYVGSHDHHLYGLDVQKKECRLKLKLGSASVFASPCVCVQHDLLYAATLAGLLVAVNMTSGTVSWKQSCDKPLFSSPVLVKLGVVVACVAGTIRCFSHTGIQMWTYQVDATIFSSPCSWPPNGLQVSQLETQEQWIICGSHDHNVYCLSSINGKLRWREKLESEVYASPFVFSNPVISNCDNLSRSKPNMEEQDCYVAVCSTKGSVYILRLCDGKVGSKYTLPGEAFSSPVVYGKKLVVGCRDNNIYCFSVI